MFCTQNFFLLLHREKFVLAYPHVILKWISCNISNMKYRV